MPQDDKALLSRLQSHHQRDAARDLTQGFFAHILANQFVAAADEAKGKFRSYLLKSFTRFIRDPNDVGNNACRTIQIR